MDASGGGGRLLSARRAARAIIVGVAGHSGQRLSFYGPSMVSILIKNISRRRRRRALSIGCCVRDVVRPQERSALSVSFGATGRPTDGREEAKLVIE